MRMKLRCPQRAFTHFCRSESMTGRLAAAIGLAGFIGLVASVGFVGFVGFAGFVAFVGFAEFASPANAQAARATAVDSSLVKVRQDVAYGTEPRQKLDVYMPAKSAGPLPVILFAHGGGWQRGNKNQHIEKAEQFAKNGVVFVCTNYRLAPSVVHPKQIQDIASAFAWIKTHAGEIGADPNRIYVMGHSAGAHLVDLLGTNERFLVEKGLSLKDIKGVISLDTASLNLNDRLAENSGEARLVGPMIRDAFGSDPKILSDASPRDGIHSGHSYPPFLMFCGQMRLSCVEQHKRFADALKKVGGNISVQEVPLSHRDINLNAGRPNTDIFKQTLAFVTGSGGSGGSASSASSSGSAGSAGNQAK